jgi:hypothetical protein
MHRDTWKKDLASEKRDRFFVFAKSDGWRGRWLGSYGPEIKGKDPGLPEECIRARRGWPAHSPKY